MIQFLQDILSSLRANKLNLFSIMLKIRSEPRLILSIKRTRVLELKLYSTVRTFFLSNKMPRPFRLATKLLS